MYRRYGFTPAKVEEEEHHIKVYDGKKTDRIVRAPHSEGLLRGSLVFHSLGAAVMYAKYVNVVPLYRQEFLRCGLHISRQTITLQSSMTTSTKKYMAIMYCRQTKCLCQ